MKTNFKQKKNRKSFKEIKYISKWNIKQKSNILGCFPHRMLWGETPRMFDFFFIFHLFVYLFSVHFYRTGGHFRSFIKNKIRMLPKI